MSREILFKGKCIGNKEWIKDGEWVEGLPMYTSNKSEKGKIDRILTLRDGYYSILLVDHETVCQYTGLTDKNGKKIFEGDIVKQFADCDELGKDLYYFYQIRWSKEYCAFEGYEIYTKETFLFPDLEDIEVIGNIFDNQELLESEG